MKKTGWFRFYNRMIDSPQVLELSDSEFRLLVSLWCLASTAEAGGHIPFSAALLRRRVMPDHSVEAVEAMIAHLIALDLLQSAEGGYTVARWLDHQYDYKSWQPSARTGQKQKERAASPDQPDPTPPQDSPGFVASDDQAVASMSQVDRNTEEERDPDVDPDLDLEGKITPPKAARAATPRPSRAKPAPVVELTPAPKPGFDYPGLWAQCTQVLECSPTWNYKVETEAIKRLLVAYPNASPTDFACFLAFLSTCWPWSNEPTRLPTFSEGAKHFAGWVKLGQPTTAPQKGDPDAPSDKLGDKFARIEQQITATLTDSDPFSGDPGADHRNVRLLRPGANAGRRGA